MAKTRLLRIAEVKHRTGYSVPSIYRLMAQGRFPRPVPLSEFARAWVEEDIDRWIDERIAAGKARRAA